MAQGTFSELFGHARARPAPHLKGRGAQGGPEPALPGGARAAPRHQATGGELWRIGRGTPDGEQAESPSNLPRGRVPPVAEAWGHCPCDMHLSGRAAEGGPALAWSRAAHGRRELRVPAAGAEASLFSAVSPQLILGCHELLTLCSRRSASPWGVTGDGEPTRGETRSRSRGGASRPGGHRRARRVGLDRAVRTSAPGPSRRPSLGLGAALSKETCGQRHLSAVTGGKRIIFTSTEKALATPEL